MDARVRHVRSADGTRIGYVCHGPAEAPTLLLVHGHPNTHAVFDALVPHLAGEYHVVCPDLRGTGLSARPERGGEDAGGDGGAGGDGDGPYGLDRFVEDIAAVIADVSPRGPVTYVGHDLGGMFGWELLARPRTRALIGRFVTFGAPALEHWSHWMRSARGPRQLAERTGQLLRIPEFWGYSMPGAARLTWTCGAFGAVVGVLNRMSGEPREPGFAAADGRAQAELYRASFFSRMRRPHYGRIDAPPPLLSIDAERDPFFTPGFSHCPDALQPGLCHVTVPGAHWAPVTHPQEIAAVLREFVAGTSGRAGDAADGDREG